jgi:hypothetical protein
MREHIKKRHPASQAAHAIGIENHLLAATASAARTYPPIAPAPAKITAPPTAATTTTTLLLQPQAPSQPPLTSLLLPNGMIYLMNQPQQTFQHPLLLSLPAQPPLLISNPATLSALAPSFLTAGNGGSILLAPPMTSHPPQIILNSSAAAPAPPAQVSLLDNRLNFVDGSFRLESNDRLTFKSQSGETVKLDILERAILEIPNLANEH